MKKICFITTVGGTIESFVLPFISYLHEYTDWSISVICNEDEVITNLLPDYVHFIPVKMERGISLGGIKACAEMYKIFKREKFDLIQYSTPNASLYASLAGALARVPVRLYCQWGMAFVGFSGLKRKIFKAEEKLVCSLSTYIEPDSYGNLNFAHEQGLYPESKGSVIWNGSACGVNLQKFDISKKQMYRKEMRRKLGIPDDAFVYGFVGRITGDKGVNELLEAFRRLEGDPFLLMVGRKEADNTISREIYDWSLECNRIVYTGYTDTVELYLSAMDCFVLPSYREGFGMGVVEAEAMGIPAIVTDIPGPRDAIIPGKTGRMIPVKNVDALEKAMAGIRGINLDELGEQAHCLIVEKFDQSRFLSEMLEDRKKLLNDPTH